MLSPAAYVESVPAPLKNVTADILGTISAPFTLCAPALVIALAPSDSVASTAVPAFLIVAPDGAASALAPMLIPSASVSAATTAYSNTSVSVPVPLE